jgi:hypothetical protein
VRKVLGRAELFCGVFAFSDIHDRGPFGLRPTAESMVIASGPSSWAGCPCHEQEYELSDQLRLGARAHPSQLDNKIYALTGPDALTFAEMARQLSRGIRRTITFVDVPPESMRAALADLGFPAWQADGLLEGFAMYRRGEAAGVEPGVREALGHPPRAFDEFARDYAPLFA